MGAKLQFVEVGIEIGDDEGLRGFGHDVLQQIAVVFGHGKHFVPKKAHPFRTAFERDDKDIRLRPAAFDVVGAVGLDKDDFALPQTAALSVPHDVHPAFVRVDDLPEIVRLLLGDVSFGQFLVVDGHDFLDVQKIGDAVHVKPLCLCFSHAYIIADHAAVCKIFRPLFLRNIL